MKVNKYVCECLINNDDIRRLVVKASNKKSAKSAARNYLIERGYKVMLKDINPMYIDNSLRAVNK